MLYNEGVYNWENMITKRYSIENIFSFYIGDFKVGVPINSPIRKDENPSFAIFQTLVGDLMFKDFGTGETGGWVKFLQLKFGISYREAVHKAFLDLIISNVSPSNGKVVPKLHYTKKAVSIGLKLTPFTVKDLDFWKQFNITENILQKYNVVSVSTVWVNDNIIINKKNGDLVFAYLINNRIKVYCPLFDKSRKWMGNTDSSCIYGLSTLPLAGKLVILSKALKDVMTLHSLGYCAICANSETSVIRESILRNLEKRFDRIVVFLDNDTAGLNTMKKYKDRYGYECISLPSDLGIKDVSDLCMIRGVDVTKQTLNNLLYEL